MWLRPSPNPPANQVATVARSIDSPPYRVISNTRVLNRTGRRRCDDHHRLSSDRTLQERSWRIVLRFPSVLIAVAFLVALETTQEREAKPWSHIFPQRGLRQRSLISRAVLDPRQ